jgi:hypothetical protein
LQIKTKIVSHNTADFKPVKQEVNGTVILPPLVFPGLSVSQESACVILSLFAGQRMREREKEREREKGRGRER